MYHDYEGGCNLNCGARHKIVFLVIYIICYNLCLIRCMYNFLKKLSW